MLLFTVLCLLKMLLFTVKDHLYLDPAPDVECILPETLSVTHCDAEARYLDLDLELDKNCAIFRD